MANLETNSSGFKILVTRMREQDLEEVLAIENRSFQTPWTKEMFLSDLDANPFARSVVARFPGEPKIIGYACFWIVMDELHLMNLAAHPDHRRQNIGEDLARWVLNMGYEMRCRTAMLEVRESNRPARQLYEKLGFKVIGVRRGYYRDPKEDALIMLIEPLSVMLAPVSDKGGHHG
jgi:ribosomal-protein-alanine N-acetyltransferase